MGIFDFLKGNNKTKSKSTEKVNVNSEQTFEINLKNKFIASKISNIVEENKEIVLTNEEIQKYINQEISERILDEPKFDFDSPDFDPLFKEAAKLIVENNQGSAALLQRKLKLGYNRASRLIDDLEMTGILGSFDGENARKVNIPNLHQLELFFQLGKIVNIRYNHFKENILPIHEEFISSKVIEIKKAKDIEEENKLKEFLKQEILNKENEKLEKEKIKQLKNQVRKELIEEGMIVGLIESDLKREPIPQDVLDKVWNRDGGKCVKCGSQEKIEFDHIIPFSKGGSNTYRNLQILCEMCNRQKSNSIG